jgi:hypothetical protein
MYESISPIRSMTWSRLSIVLASACSFGTWRMYFVRPRLHDDPPVSWFWDVSIAWMCHWSVIKAFRGVEKLDQTISCLVLPVLLLKLAPYHIVLIRLTVPDIFSSSHYVYEHELLAVQWPVWAAPVFDRTVDAKHVVDPSLSERKQ